MKVPTLWVNGVKVPTLWGEGSDTMGVKGKGSDTMTDEVLTLSCEGFDTLA